jgi:hypothetical protein
LSSWWTVSCSMSPGNAALQARSCNTSRGRNINVKPLSFFLSFLPSFFFLSLFRSLVPCSCFCPNGQHLFCHQSCCECGGVRSRHPLPDIKLRPPLSRVSDMSRCYFLIPQGNHFHCRPCFLLHDNRMNFWFGKKGCSVDWLIGRLIKVTQTSNTACRVVVTYRNKCRQLDGFHSVAKAVHHWLDWLVKVEPRISIKQSNLPSIITVYYNTAA